MSSSLGNRSSSPVIQYDRKRITRKKILDAALELFSRHGFDGATVSDIASRAAVAHGTVFLHFTSKSGVYAEAVRAAATKFLHTMQSRDIETFDVAAETWVGCLANESEFSRLLRSLGGDHGRRPVESAAMWANGEFERFWRDWLQGRDGACGRGGPSTSERARFVVAALAGLAATRFDDQSDAEPVAYRDLIRFVEQATLSDR